MLGAADLADQITDSASGTPYCLSAAAEAGLPSSSLGGFTGGLYVEGGHRHEPILRPLRMNCSLAYLATTPDPERRSSEKRTWRHRNHLFFAWARPKTSRKPPSFRRFPQSLKPLFFCRQALVDYTPHGLGITCATAEPCEAAGLSRSSSKRLVRVKRCPAHGSLECVGSPAIMHNRPVSRQ